MVILLGRALYAAVLEVTRLPGARCAVAFWGSGAEALFINCRPGASSEMARDSLKDRDIKVVCNLVSGGTNPAVIETLMRAGVEVLQRDDLHAKVFFNDDGAVVASANASANGLGLQGCEQAFWIEAGVRFSEPSVLKEWFEDLWNKSRKITTEDLEAARKRNGQIRVNIPTLPFAAFDPEMEPLPLVSWKDGSDWEFKSEHFKDQMGFVDNSALDLVKWGEETWGPEDETVLLRTSPDYSPGWSAS